MRIWFVAAEVAPFAKVGGLADVAEGLPHQLRAMGHDVQVISPCHAPALEPFAAAPAGGDFEVHDALGPHQVRLATVEGLGGVPVRLVLDDRYFGRPGIYGHADDRLRYEFFCRVVARLLRDEPEPPDILHINDWHTAPLAFTLRNLAWDHPGLRKVASVLTIHNLRYRGPDEFNDLLGPGIYYADYLTTVSPTYARDILTPAFGEGLDLLLRLRADRLQGIVNGLDGDLFNPGSDRHIAVPFDPGSLSSRKFNRRALQDELKLPAAEGPIAAMVARLTEQKGVDLVLGALPAMLRSGGQVVVLGSGDREIETDLRRLAAEHPDGVRFIDRFDDPLARRIYAGSDVLLMPSRYEPCGLGQLIAMRYGCVPLARRTGGLADTVTDVDDGQARTGFLFDEFSVDSFLAAWDRTVREYLDADRWAAIQMNGMRRDSSWVEPAKRYAEVYELALSARR